MKIKKNFFFLLLIDLNYNNFVQNYNSNSVLIYAWLCMYLNLCIININDSNDSGLEGRN